MTVVTSLSGFASPYNRLASLGVKTQNDGTLEFDAAIFDAAMVTNEDEIISFFIGDDTAGTIGIAETFDKLISQYVDSGDGILTKKVSGYSDQVSDIDDQIDDMERRIDKYEQRLRMQFAAMEQAISQMQSQGSQMMGMLQSLQKK